MATRRVTRSQTSAFAGTQNIKASNDREMVLSVKSSEKIKKPSKGKSGKKTKADSRKKTDKLDALKPKKPPTAFFYFLEDFRKEYQEKNPDIKSMRDVGKACGEKWKTMTYEEKVNYYDIATQKRAEFDEAMADYQKKKESGEYLEYEQDSDFDG